MEVVGRGEWDLEEGGKEEGGRGGEEGRGWAVGREEEGEVGDKVGGGRGGKVGGVGGKRRRGRRVRGREGW